MQYDEPSWKVSCEVEGFTLEMVKNGEIVNETKLWQKSCFVLGRARGAVDVALENPTVSRFHVVLQFDGRVNQWKMYDLGSTHGTFLNKNRVEARKYVTIPIGSTFKLGCSTRFFVLNGPQDLMPPEYDSENLRELRSKKFQVEKKEPPRKIVQVVNEDNEEEDYDDEDDEVLDETVRKRKRGQKKKQEEIVWNRKKLEVDLKRLVDLNRSTRREMEELMLKEQLGEDDATDSLEAFMQGSQKDLHRKEIKRLAKLRKEYETDRKHRIRLLRAIVTEMKDMSDDRIVADAIERVSSRSGNGTAPKMIDVSRAVPSQMRYAVHRLNNKQPVTSFKEKKKKKKEMMPPPPKKKEMMPPPPAVRSKKEDTMMPPPPVQSKMLPPAPVKKPEKKLNMPPPPSVPTNTQEEEPPKKKRRRRRKKKSKQPQREHDDSNEDEASVWVPPQNQTGDGKTSLNAKFGY